MLHDGQPATPKQGIMLMTRLENFIAREMRAICTRGRGRKRENPSLGSFWWPNTAVHSMESKEDRFLVGPACMQKGSVQEGGPPPSSPCRSSPRCERASGHSGLDGRAGRPLDPMRAGHPISHTGKQEAGWMEYATEPARRGIRGRRIASSFGSWEWTIFLGG